MSKKKLGPGGYTRGFEIFGHYMSMLRSSIGIHLFISVIGGLILGSIWFYIGLEGRAKSNIGQYIKASVISFISDKKESTFDLGFMCKKEGFWGGKVGDSEEENRGENSSDYGELCTRFPASVKGESAKGFEKVVLLGTVVFKLLRGGVFGGRTLGFLAKQWVFRAIVSLLILFVLSAVVITGRGRRMSDEKHKRGARLVDIEKKRKSERAREIALIALASVVVGGTLFFFTLGGPGRAQIGNYYWSSIYLSFRPAACLASPDSECMTAWYSGMPEDGFRDNEKVNSWLKTEVYEGRSIGSMAVTSAVGMALIFIPALLFFRAMRKRREEGKSCIKLAGVDIPKGSECYHFLFSGSPGSGKSTAIKELLDQVRRRGQRAVVYDPSGEYIGPYYREGKDVIMNPLDHRSKLWTLWSDVREKTDYRTIARSLFPSGGKDPFWNDAGATLFAATAEKLAESNEKKNRRLYEFLTTGAIGDLAEFLSGTAAAKFLDPDAGAMPSNLIATVTSKLAAWELLRDPESESGAFSIKKFIEDESSDSWMFLAMRQDHQAALRPLISLWCSLAATSILSLPPSDERRMWFVLDEVASLQRLPSLPPILSMGRKHGAAVVMGLQSIPQLRDSYGRDAAAALASQPQTWLALRTVEPDTAKWLEQALGEAEVEEIREAVSMGADDIRDGVSIMQNLRKRAAAMTSEIMNLPDLEGFMKLPGDSPILRVRLETKDRKFVAPMYVPRSAEGAGS